MTAPNNLRDDRGTSANAPGNLYGARHKMSARDFMKESYFSDHPKGMNNVGEHFSRYRYM